MIYIHIYIYIAVNKLCYMDIYIYYVTYILVFLVILMLLTISTIKEPFLFPSRDIPCDLGTWAS